MIPVTRLLSEITFSTSRAGGPGGQHVNKVETKVTLKWDVAGSNVISKEEKEILLHRLASRLSKEGILIITAQESRSQSANKDRVLEKLGAVLNGAFHKKKARKPTRVSATSRKKRLQHKRAHSEKKKWRRRPPDA